MSTKHINASHLTAYHMNNRQTEGLLEVAEAITDPQMRERVIAKLNAARKAFQALYGEVQNADGTLLVKHPAIGFITIDEIVKEEPERLFASRVKSMSSLMIRIYRADGLISEAGSVTYVNRDLLLEVEMSQSEFAGVVSTSMGTSFAATIRSNMGKKVDFEGDLNSVRNQLIMSDTLEMTSRLDERVAIVLKKIADSAGEGKPVGAKLRQEIAFDAGIVKDWTDSNPAYYAKRLGEFTAQTTSDIRMEVESMAKIKGLK
jgi:hypothetical protein